MFVKYLSPEKVSFYRKKGFFNFKHLVFLLWYVLHIHFIQLAVDKHGFIFFEKYPSDLQ